MLTLVTPEYKEFLLFFCTATDFHHCQAVSIRWIPQTGFRTDSVTNPLIAGLEYCICLLMLASYLWQHMQKIVSTENINTLFHVKGEKALTLQTDYSALRILLLFNWGMLEAEATSREQAYVREALKTAFLQAVVLHYWILHRCPSLHFNLQSSHKHHFHPCQ